jgi:hypothetical protein
MMRMRGLVLAGLLLAPSFGSAAACMKPCCCTGLVSPAVCARTGAAKACCRHCSIKPLPVATTPRWQALHGSARTAAFRLALVRPSVAAHFFHSRRPTPDLTQLCILRC